MLIRQAEVQGKAGIDVRLVDGLIVEMGAGLARRADEVVLDAQGGALLPGLHDHHLHLYSLAAARASIPCGPPRVHTPHQLRAALHAAAMDDRQPWLRGVGYHETVAGEIDRDWLDANGPARPLRIQHRSGRLWLLNSLALEALASGEGDDPLERIAGRATGRLYDADDWLRQRLPRQRPSLQGVSRLLASYGVTAVTDTTPQNSAATWQDFAAAQARGDLRQALMVMGDGSLDAASDQPGLLRGAHKFHLHEHELPDFEALCADIERSHRAGRGAAFHCVTRTDLVFALAALQASGGHPGDRIEHASVAPPELLSALRAQGVTVVTQPHFIQERGDAYRLEVAAEDQPWLYRLRGLLEAGIPLAGGSDAPFGEPSPWAAMQAAVSRRTQGGAVMGAAEALTPEQALALFTTPLDAPGALPRRIAVGAAADLCLLDRPWAAARADLAAVQVRQTWRAGQTLWVC